MVDAEKDKKESKEGDEKKKVQKDLKVLSTGKAEAGKGRKKCDAKPDVFESSKRKSLEQSEKADLGDLDDIFAKKPKKASWEGEKPSISFLQ